MGTGREGMGDRFVQKTLCSYVSIKENIFMKYTNRLLAGTNPKTENIVRYYLMPALEMPPLCSNLLAS